MVDDGIWSDAEYDEALDGLGPVALRAFLSLGIADELAAGAQSTDELAGRIPASVDTLRALMEYLATRGIVSATPAGYALNNRSLHLMSSHPSGIASWLQDGGPGRMMLDSFTAAAESVRTGHSTFEIKYGSSFFDIVESDSEDSGFTSLRGRHGQRIASALIGVGLDLDGRHIVDVGGGNGDFLTTLLMHYKHARGTLFDRPAPVRDALFRPRIQCVSARFDAVSGDFFEEVPFHGDVMLLSNVLHNWPDAEARKIVDSVSQAVSSEGTVLVIESCTDQLPSRVATSMDLRMALLCGGRERTSAEYDELFIAAGFTRRAFHFLTNELNLLVYMRKNSDCSAAEIP